jgi:hypothetical protein
MPDCNGINLKRNNYEPFIGCDGKPVSDDLIERRIEYFISIEEYEMASENKAELERRKKFRETILEIQHGFTND